MSKVLAIANAVVRDALRRKVTWVVIVFGGLLAVAIPSLPSYGVGVVGGVFREVALALTYVAALVVVLALSVTRIPSEVERRTVFNILSRDVSRWQYLLGTWMGIQAVMAGVIAAFYAVAVGVGWLTYGAPSLLLAEGSLAIWCEMAVISAFCLLLTARWGAVTASVAALAFVFIGHSVSGLFTGGSETALPPWWLPSLDVFNIINPVAYGNGVSLGYVASMLLAFVAASLLLLIAASAAFQTRDL